MPCRSEEYGAAAKYLRRPDLRAGDASRGHSRRYKRRWLARSARGANEETDEQLRERYALAWAANNGCANTRLQELGAFRARRNKREASLTAIPRGQGTVDIVVRGADVLPPKLCWKKVRAAIAPNVPINDDWLVKGPHTSQLRDCRRP